MQEAKLDAESLKIYAKQILQSLGFPSEDESFDKQYVCNQAQSKTFNIHGSEVYVKVTDYERTCEAEVNFNLPENAVLADTYINHCAEIEKLEKNPGHNYGLGPEYKDYNFYMWNKVTEAYSPWHRRNFIVCSKHYPTAEIDSAVKNCAELAKKFFSHLSEVPSLRYWKSTDEEVIARAKEVIANADLYEAGVDREEKAHWIKDRNSFFKGWMSPFADNGKGCFDIHWPGSVDYAAKNMGIEGSFEYAVASLLLVDEEFTAKARKACHIIKETRVYAY